MTILLLRTLGALLLTSLVACTGDAGSCPDAASLQAQLDAASPGDTVSLGACAVAGPLTIPAGVRLEGAGRDASTITGAAGMRAVTLVPGDGASATALAGLTVQSDGCAAIVAMGAGAVSIEDVRVRASRGVGVAIEGATAATVSSVAIEGPIEAATADARPPPLPPFRCGSSDVATHGIVLVDVATATIDDATVSGLAAFGIVAVRTDLTLLDSAVTTGLGTGLEVFGGSASIERVTLSGIRTGAGAIESYAGVFLAGADVTTTGLTVEDNGSFGLFHDGATAVHRDLIAQRNGFAAAWAQDVTSLDIGGASRFEDNAFAGIVALQSSGVLVGDATIARTVEGVRISGARTIRSADGIALVDTEATLTRLALEDNDRVGALVDLAGGTTSAVTLTDVTVGGTGTELGVVAQNGTVAMGWDSGVTRSGATAANDAAFTGTLPIADIVGPPCFPPAMELTSSGIGALL